MIDINHVSFQYSGAEQENLQELVLHIKKGECVVLTGESGCGKNLCDQVDKYTYSPLLRRGNVRDGSH